jgi:hypothetical protein
MGEFATVKATGERVKIGTCEDMLYLRWDQRQEVSYEDGFDGTERFRFPWPDEDGTEPGAFDDPDRGFPLFGFEQPADLEHGSAQFASTYRRGYLLSLPCPEGPNAPEGIARNGYGGPCSLIQQAWRGGRLVGIARCNGCGAAYRLEDGYEEAAAVALRSEADRGRPSVHVIADRLLAGYSQSL